jgi:GT2 family glycosyltransferase
VAPLEIIVVDDNSPDESAAVAEAAGARVIRNSERRGPAHARNLGAEAARGTVLVFLDADVCVHHDVLARIAGHFDADRDLDAVFGSYDSVSDSANFITCYKNLQHHFVHQTGRSEAATFWSGCGAVLRQSFLKLGGFSVEYKRPAIEDIEFGIRMTQAGMKIRLDKQILVTHLKVWTLGTLIRTEVFDRAIPWTRLLLADGRIPNDLNLRLAQRASAVLAFLLLFLFVAGTVIFKAQFAAPLLLIVVLLLASYWTDEVLRGRGGPTTVVMLLLLSTTLWAATPPHSRRMAVLMLGAYALLFVRCQLRRAGHGVRRVTGILIACYLAGTLLFIAGQLPDHLITAGVMTVTGGIVALNLRFYMLLAEHWGGLYSISSVPFHVLYLLYSGGGFLAGAAGYWFTRSDKPKPAHRPCPILQVDVDAGQLLDLDAGTAGTALVVFRYQGSVVGQRELPVRRGVVAASTLRACLPEMAAAIWERAMRDPGTPSLIRATVVVCTRDRTDDLARCLKSLSPVLAAGHEVLIIDSCPSNSKTEWLVASYPGVRYVREPRPGAGIARNRGLIEASCEIIAFTDDDARVEPDWLDRLLANFDDPVTAMVTGLTMPVELQTESQVWFERTNGFHRGFRRRTFALDELDPLLAGLTGASVNMAIRKSVLADTGLFDEALGPGTICHSGEDHELYYRVLARGHRITYDPSALVWHRHRREWASLRKTIYGYGVGVFAWWTRAFTVEREWGVLMLAVRYFLGHHVRELVGALSRKPGHVPLDLAWAEFIGALAGPFAYFRSRSRIPQAETRIGEARMPGGGTLSMAGKSLAP